MHVISYRALREFGEAHPAAKAPLRAWYKTAQKAEWQNLAEVRQTYPSADSVGGLTVFNIGGNKYRLIAGINYETQVIYIKHVLTHEEYDEETWKR
jgi:mRNA interferase HigB